MQHPPRTTPHAAFVLDLDRARRIEPVLPDQATVTWGYAGEGQGRRLDPRRLRWHADPHRPLPHQEPRHRPRPVVLRQAPRPWRQRAGGLRPRWIPVAVFDVEPGSTYDVAAVWATGFLSALYAAAALLRLPTLADKGYDGAGAGIATPAKGRGLHRTGNPLKKPNYPLVRRRHATGSAAPYARSAIRRGSVSRASPP